MADYGDRALALIDPLYDGGVIHIICERSGEHLTNLYTLIIYAAYDSLYSIPAAAERKSYGSRYVCFRFRERRTDIAGFLAAIERGATSIAGESIRYDLALPTVGFLQSQSPDGFDVAMSPLPRSLWTRERVSASKSLAGMQLSERTLPSIAKELDFLNTLRWTAANVSMYPEKLGNVDEWWPSPLEESFRQQTLYITDLFGLAESHRITSSVSLYNHGLQTDYQVVNGIGPHKISGNFDAISVDVFIDDIIQHRSSGPVLQQINFNIGVSTGQTILLSAKPRRENIVLPIAPRTPTTGVMGRSIHPAQAVWNELGARWRSQHSRLRPPRTERVYDPRRPDAVRSAFDDLRSLKAQPVKRIIAVDRYSLDRAAIEAIIAIALAHSATVSIDVLTKFEQHQSSPADELSIDAVAQFKRIARSASIAFGCHIRLWRINGIDLHDRFLFLDNQVWHVGHSFNALGEALSAVVEMSDIEAKAHLADLLEPFLTGDPEFDSAEPDV